MPSDPLVSCVMLAMSGEREDMRARALRAYEAQTYENRELIIYCGPRDKTIGELRNIANDQSYGSIIAHMDDDDVSYPNRLTEQVALLQSSGADLVGYNECLFWDTYGQRVELPDPRELSKTMWVNSFDNNRGGEAWLYTAPGPGPESVVLGASMMYWRSTWKGKPFTHTNNGEDRAFASGLRVAAVSAVFRAEIDWRHEVANGRIVDVTTPYEPRLICGVHAGNTSTRISGETVNWHRARNCDDYCRRLMSMETINAKP